MGPIRILVADDQPVVLRGIRAELDAARDIVVVGEAARRATLLRQASEQRPDVIVLDPTLDGSAGTELVAEIDRLLPATRTIVFSACAAAADVRAAFKAGGAGYVLKRAPLEDLAEAVRVVASGETYVTRSLAAAVLGDAGAPGRRAAGRQLSDREVQVLELLAQDKSSKEIAQTLRISPRTVDTHRTNIMRKLDIHTVTGLVRFAWRTGMARPS